MQYLLNITNNGSVVLQNITILDTLPPELAYANANLTPDSTSPLTWYLGQISPGESVMILLNATANSITGCVSVTNILNTTAQPPNGNNVTSNATATSMLCEASVSAIKVDITPSPPAPGGWIWYKLNITNSGLVPLSRVVVTDSMPMWVYYDNASPAASNLTPDNRTAIWYLGRLNASQSIIIWLNTTVDMNATNGTILQNNVSVVGVPYNGDNVTANDSSSVGVHVPAIDVSKWSSASDIKIKDRVTFTLQVINTGWLNLTEVNITDPLPSGLSYVSANLTPNSTKPLTWIIKNLTIGKSVTIHVVAESTETGLQKNTMYVVALPTNGPEISGNDSTSVYVHARGGRGSRGTLQGYIFVAPPSQPPAPTPPSSTSSSTNNPPPSGPQQGGSTSQENKPGSSVPTPPVGAAVAGDNTLLWWVGSVLIVGASFAFVLYWKKIR